MMCPSRPCRPCRPFFFLLLAGACLLAAACRPGPSAPVPAGPDAPPSAITPEPTPSPAAPAVRMSDPLTTEALRLNQGRPGVVRLAWTTQSEQNSFAFFVMRARDAKGPFEVMNKEPIQAAGMSSTPRKYEFFDTAVRVGEVYYYYMRQVDLDGTKKDITEWTKRSEVNRLNLDAATTGTAAK